jgi:hypothetical protein
VVAHFVAGEALTARLAAGARVNTDDGNHVEFAFARHVGDFANVDALLASARARGEDRPALTGGEVSWDEVEEERITQTAGEGTEPDIPPGLPADLEVRAGAVVNYVAGNLSGALAKWQRQDRGPVGVTELGLVAEGLAEAGREDALGPIEKLHAAQPIEADVALARLRLRQGGRAEAAELISRALVAYRRDPWPSPMIMRRAVDLAMNLSDGAPDVARQLLEAVREPFAVRSLETSRMTAQLWIAFQLHDPARCAAAWHELEPWIPWDAQSLAARRDCYLSAHDERADRALRDAATLSACAESPESQAKVGGVGGWAWATCL